MLIYIAKSTAILATLLVFYKLFLEKESIHVFKRFFLLASVIVAVGIPAITFTTYIEAQPIFEPVAIDYSQVAFETVEEKPKADYVAITLWFLYGLGVLFFGIRFLFNLGKLLIKINRNEQFKESGFINVLINNLQTPHTFFKYIFFNKEKFKSNAIPKEVQIHEQAHAKQLHSIDVIIIEILQVFFWFNPFIYLLKNYVKLNHEFLADKAVLDAGTNLKNYQNILLKYSYTHNQYPIANAIHYSSTRLSNELLSDKFGQVKKRFTIMKTKTPLKNSWLKSMLLLPLLAMLIYGFSAKKTVTERQIISQEKISPLDKEIQEQLKEITDLKINYVIENISIKVNKNKDLLINGKTKITLNKLPDELNKILAVYDAKQLKEIKAIIEVQGTIEKSFIENIKEKVKQTGIDYRFFDTLNMNRNQVIEYNKLYKDIPISHEEFHYTKQSFWMKDKNGNKKAKRYNELSEYYKRKWLLFPPNEYIKKQISKDDFEKLKDIKTYVVRVNGIVIDNNKLKNYNREDFVTYSVSEISRFSGLPQKYHYNLITENAYKTQLFLKEQSDKRANQTKATPEQLKEYEKLATFYSSKPWSETVVKLKDVERMKTLRNLMSVEQKKNAEPFPNLPPPPARSTEVEQDALRRYQIKNELYEKLRNEKPHFVEKSKLLQERMQKLFSDLGGMYFRLSKENKRKVKRPVHPHYPYYKLKKDGEYYYKKVLTKEDRKYLPIPPPPPPMPSKKTTSKGSKELIKLANDFEQKAEKYAKMVRERNIKKISGDVLSKEYKEVLEIHQSYMKLAKKENILVTPPPPPPPAANKKTGALNNNKKYYYVGNESKRKAANNVEVIEIVEEAQRYQPQEIIEVEEVQEEIIERPVEVIEVEEQEQVTIDEIDELTNEEILKLPKNKNKKIIYYINGKKASKKQVDKLNVKKIKEIKVKRSDKKKAGEIYITTK